MKNENVYYDLVSQVVNYIETNIGSDIALEDIAENICMSKHHLHRLFKALTGKKLINYVLARKLARSLDQLINTDLRIIDIANDYGFKYEQTYIRAFMREFNTSPDTLRKSKIHVHITDTVDNIMPTAIGNEIVVFEPSISVKPGFFLTGIEHHINRVENYEKCFITELGNDFYYNRSGSITNTKAPNVYYGFVRLIENDSVYLYYIPSLEVIDQKVIPEGMINFYVPAKKYAIFKYFGMHHPNKTTIKDLLVLYGFIEKWIENSKYYRSDNFRFERIDNDVCGDNYCEVDIFVPVGLKNELLS